jgi:plastocyanin
MPRVGRKASSLVVVLLFFTLAVVTAVGVPAAAQDATLEKGAAASRVLTIGAIEEGGICPGGITPPCWDTLTLVARPGETLSVVADLRSSDVTHNIQILDGTGPDAKPLAGVAYSPLNTKGDATVQGANLLHNATFTVPSEFSGSLGFICQVHKASMKGKIVTPVAAGAAAGGEPVHHLGVHFLAYWVGVIAFAILFLVYGITFFLFKYNETPATTDHWDRAGAAPPAEGKKMVGGSATLLAIVIGVAALAAIIYVARMG